MAWVVPRRGEKCAGGAARAAWMGVLLASVPAAAEEGMREDYCALWARSALAVYAAASPDSTRDRLSAMYKKFFGDDCLILPDQPPLPGSLETDGEFLDRLSRAYSPGESGGRPGTPAWTSWCKMNFPRSFSATDGTVILEANNRGRRVRCPG